MKVRGEEVVGRALDAAAEEEREGRRRRRRAATRAPTRATPTRATSGRESARPVGASLRADQATPPTTGAERPVPTEPAAPSPRAARAREVGPTSTLSTPPGGLDPGVSPPALRVRPSAQARTAAPGVDADVGAPPPALPTAVANVVVWSFAAAAAGVSLVAQGARPLLRGIRVLRRRTERPRTREDAPPSWTRVALSRGRALLREWTGI